MHKSTSINIKIYNNLHGFVNNLSPWRERERSNPLYSRRITTLDLSYITFIMGIFLTLKELSNYSSRCLLLYEETTLLLRLLCHQKNSFLKSFFSFKKTLVQKYYFHPILEDPWAKDIKTFIYCLYINLIILFLGGQERRIISLTKYNLL